MLTVLTFKDHGVQATEKASQEVKRDVVRRKKMKETYDPYLACCNEPSLLALLLLSTKQGICSCLPQSLQAEELAGNPTLLLVFPSKGKHSWKRIPHHTSSLPAPHRARLGAPLCLTHPTHFYSAVKSMLRTNCCHPFRTKIGINSVL